MSDDNGPFDDPRYDVDGLPTTPRYAGANEAKDLALMLSHVLAAIHGILDERVRDADINERQRDFHNRHLDTIEKVVRWLDPENSLDDYDWPEGL